MNIFQVWKHWLLASLETEIENIENQLRESKKEHESLSKENSELRGKNEILSQRIQQLSVTESEYTNLLRKFGNLEGQLTSMRSSKAKNEKN